MAASQRTDLINKTYKVLKKHFSPVPPPGDRSVFEHIVYACCLENTPYPKADEAFARIQDLSYDWNEVRVTSVSELAESLAGYVDPRRTASNLRRILQSVFESQYSFDLEHLKKQNLGKTIKDLERHSGTTPFIVSYVTQHALSGHSIPVDRGALEVLYVAGVIDDKEKAKGVVPGLERAIPKKQGIEFGSLLHQLAAQVAATPYAPQVRTLLLEINPDGKDRLPKRPSRKKKAAAQPKKKPAPAAKKPETKPAAAKKSAKKKKTTKKQVTKKLSKKTLKGAARPTPKKKKTSGRKKSATKQLAKRKPR